MTTHYDASTGSRRKPWHELPRSVRTGIEDVLGGTVAAATSQQGGFSDGLAARLQLDDGRRAFAKAVDAEAAPGVAAFHRREVVVNGGLPPGVPVPRLLGTHDEQGWVALVFEDVEGALPAQPWRQDELERVLDALTGLAERLTPAPRLNSGDVSPRLGGWSRLTEGSRSLAKLAVIAPDAVRELDDHLALEERLPEVIAGETLTHGDLYPFNVLLTEERVMVVDWPHAWTGPAYADLLMLLGSVALGGVDPEPYAVRHPLLRGVEPEAVDVVISAQAGFLLAAACSMDSADAGTDPRLEAMMTALGRASLRWLSLRRI
ncbi:aminoglycoside phosphotransferase family protein [Streptomyces sp. NBC_00838]|uniref:aminoglycoside phosphotransferase family protein n=1 Tax=Streptomyces sp. NBC_00838 TaxID=2903680 RepID=UPI003867F2C7|nr:aminoglycoside phosphotransferase family protein [Streptomyces sp. NBC_00838]